VSEKFRPRTDEPATLRGAPWGPGRIGAGAPSRRTGAPSRCRDHPSHVTLTEVGERGIGAPVRAAGARAPSCQDPTAHRAKVGRLVSRGETFLTPRGTLALRGPMVAAAAYALRRLRATRWCRSRRAISSIPTMPARLDRSTATICITAPPSGIMAVGGYRFLSQDLQEWAGRLARVHC